MLSIANAFDICKKFQTRIAAGSPAIVRTRRRGGGCPA
ncbi:hypothetical protein CPter291_2687 [Collimonas pratensis]|uniref:Uncharacterized protein n=1 Tax=Collimonas pratensis TaxID=279113 RepID=A0ABM5Z7A7_9BURK|nr:hypothetical protein CPter291_2687 [Collimonas pratensis]